MGVYISFRSLLTSYKPLSLIRVLDSSDHNPNYTLSVICDVRVHLLRFCLFPRHDDILLVNST